MSNLKEKLTKGGATAVIVITILAVCYGLSWIVTCGIIKLITMCFGLTFKWSIATGIWLIICILKSVFSVTVKKQSRSKLTIHRCRREYISEVRKIEDLINLSDIILDKLENIHIDAKGFTQGKSESVNIGIDISDLNNAEIEISYWDEKNPTTGKIEHKKKQQLVSQIMK